MKKSLFSAIIAILIFTNNFAQTTWEAPYVGSSKEILYLPDANAVYWRYGWERTENQTSGYIIKGEFPDARYFSYNIYDDNTKTSLGSLTDINIVADGNNEYSIYIVPEGTIINAKNVFYFKKNLTKISIMLRHYLPKNNINGNKPLPTIANFDPKNNAIEKANKSTTVPKFSKEDVDKYLIPMFNKFMENSEEEMEKLMTNESKKTLNIEELICKQVVEGAFNFYKKDSLIHSYNLKSDGTYPNKDNHYLTMPMIRFNPSDVCIVKFKAPKFPKTKSEFTKSDVRYFSISQGDELTYNMQTIADYQFLIHPDGFIYIVIGNETEALKNKAKSLKINFMPWLTKEKMLLIYRNMLPNENYKLGVNSVPEMDKTKPAEKQRGERFIGEFSPISNFFSTEIFMKSTSIPKF
ncbi:hypothetical protein [Flavobacterium succinicans]|uniref:DUF1254 domain-containing protein n=1 Tax=Flavobacterium succinicans TaxID=29536 RepID=A0A199XW55_9FLAO|nr:hypothetical protein [Flavobacterium succinicans]OAZ05491.1 hypothetical protein FLB_00210 [Flavobacterium succinicans]